jgi:nucleoside-diphosphate-sugar epimerase
MSDIAIIGAGGFVGLRLTESLVLEGRTDVRAIVRNYRNMAGLCRFGSAVDVRRADAEKVERLAEALSGVRTVVNVTTGVPDGIVRSTGTIYEACLRAKVSRFVHLSSAVVYGDVETPIGDDAAPNRRHWMPYARAKSAAENWLRSRMEQRALDVVVLRPGIVWGVRSPHTLDIARSLAAKNAFLVGGGAGIFNGIYIDNLVSAILTASAFPTRAAGFYHVGDRETVSWRELYDALGRPLGCDVSKLPQVSADRFPWSIVAAIDAVQNQAIVNKLYHAFKGRIPDSVKIAIKAQLEGSASYDRQARAYASAPSVSRELWHLQRVRHKLPIRKFVETFHVEPPVSFADGVRKTAAWLEALGVTRTRLQDLPRKEALNVA